MGNSYSSKRILGVLLSAVLMMFMMYFVMEGVYHYSIVHAQGVAAGTGSGSGSAVTITGVSDPTDFVTDWAMIKAQGYVWGAVLALALGLMIFQKYNDQDHWINEKSRLWYVIVGVGGVLASLADAKLTHTGFGGVLVTAIMAVKLIISPPAQNKALA